MVRLNSVVITLASAGKFRPSETEEVCLASPEVFCGMVSTTRSLMLALPVLSTVAAINRWPAEFTTLNCSLSRKDPLRV